MVNVEQARVTLEDILSTKEYQIYYEDSRNSLQIWWDQAKNWIEEQLANLFSNFEPSSSFASGVLLTIVLVVIACVFCAVYLLTRNVNRNRTFRNQKPLQSMDEMSWSFHNHLAEARKQESQEAYVLATRHLFLALLLYFHEKEWLVAKRWKTNGEYYEELRRKSEQRADQFYIFSLLFDEVTYGDRSINKEDYIPYRNEVMNWLDEEVQKNTQ